MPSGFRFQLERLLAAAGLLHLALFIAPSAQAEICAAQDFSGAQYIVCDVSPEQRPQLQLFWKDENGEAYRNFSRLASALQQSGKSLILAFNAGMYETDFAPIGLYVENGKVLRSVKTPDPPKGKGPVANFFKKPNGVFFLNEKEAAIVPTRTYLKMQPKARLATQSGPMLVIDGRINPIFIQGSSDRTHRSGVGICEGNLIRFAISMGSVNFHDFARLFRDHLHCRNALFLDGGGGAGFYSPALQRNDFSWHGGYGPMFGLVEDARGKPQD